MKLLLSIYKVVISVCMFVSPIIPQEPHDRFASNFELGRNTEMFLAWFRDAKLSELTLTRAKTVI